MLTKVAVLVALCWLMPVGAEAVQKTCHLQWQPVPNATGYRVKYRTLNIDVLNVTQVMLAAVGIDQPGQQESVTVTPYNAGGEGPPSTPVLVNIDQVTAAPTVATTVSLTCP